MASSTPPRAGPLRCGHRPASPTATSAFRQANRERAPGRHCRRQLPVRDCRIGRAARAGIRPCAGSTGLRSRRSAAVMGMNCAMPWACQPLRVTGPTASDRNRLSCQMTRAKNSKGSPCAAAADSTIWQMEDGSAVGAILSPRHPCSPPPGIKGVPVDGPPSSIGRSGSACCAFAIPANASKHSKTEVRLARRRPRSNRLPWMTRVALARCFVASILMKTPCLNCFDRRGEASAAKQT